MLAAAVLTLWQQGLRPVELRVDGIRRSALAHAGEGSGKHPIVFVFHGHGGSSRNAARSFGIERSWPEATVIYPQGLPTAGRYDPEGKKPGWQKAADEEGDRDLKLFDRLLKLALERGGDPKRVFATGHSNGGGFTYLLWSERGDRLTGVAPCAAVGKLSPTMRPLPCLHIAGEKDERVPFAGQQRVMAGARKLDGCSETGRPWHGVGTWYDSSKGSPFVEIVHKGGHVVPERAGDWIVAFFKSLPLE